MHEGADSATSQRPWTRWLAPTIGVVLVAGLLAVGDGSDDAAPVASGSPTIDDAVVADVDADADVSSSEAATGPAAADAAAVPPDGTPSPDVSTSPGRADASLTTPAGS